MRSVVQSFRAIADRLQGRGGLQELHILEQLLERVPRVTSLSEYLFLLDHLYAVVPRLTAFGLVQAAKILAPLEHWLSEEDYLRHTQKLTRIFERHSLQSFQPFALPLSWHLALILSDVSTQGLTKKTLTALETVSHTHQQQVPAPAYFRIPSHFYPSLDSYTTFLVSRLARELLYRPWPPKVTAQLERQMRYDTKSLSILVECRELIERRPEFAQFLATTGIKEEGTLFSSGLTHALLVNPSIRFNPLVQEKLFAVLDNVPQTDPDWVLVNWGRGGGGINGHYEAQLVAALPFYPDWPDRLKSLIDWFKQHHPSNVQYTLGHFLSILPHFPPVPPNAAHWLIELFLFDVPLIPGFAPAEFDPKDLELAQLTIIDRFAPCLEPRSLAHFLSRATSYSLKSALLGALPKVAHAPTPR